MIGMKKRVVVGLSGGVDSSVAAHLLIEQGYEVVGVFMRNWHDESVTINNECPWIDDSNDAILAAEALGIPFQVVDMSADYKQRIVDYMFREYQAGRTPNPDVLCNREIKFDLFLKAALQLKADFVATGHYCQKAEVNDPDGNVIYRLIAGVDANKDQSYFLCQLNQYQLSKALFPIGHLQKAQVREIARAVGLPNAEKKDSQGLCFIGKVKLPVFLQQQLSVQKGNLIELPVSGAEFVLPSFPENYEADTLEKATASYSFHPSMGQVVGTHNGAHFFTIGQRKGLGVGGRPEPLFIVHTDTSTNSIYLAQGEDHPALLRRGLVVENNEVHWVRPDLKLQPGQRAKYMVRIRYRQPLFECELVQTEEKLYCLFQLPQKSVAPGQFIAWYDRDELIGSGVIA